MKFEIHRYDHVGDKDDLNDIKQLLRLLITQVRRIMANQEEAAATLEAVNEKLVKVGTEISTLHVLIEELKAAVAVAGEVQPVLQAAIDKVAAQSGVLDDLNADAS